MADRFDTFGTLLNKLKGMENKSITLTEKDIYRGDRFLIFGFGYDSHTITFKKRKDGVWFIFFNNDEPIILEECPTSFFLTLIKNLP